MLNHPITQNDLAAIKTEQVKAYFQDANDLNLAGALVFSLLIYVVYDATPWWTWAPALGFLYLVTLFRANHIRQYRRAPDSRSATQWINGQAASAGLAGVCWGVANTAMLAHLPVPLQLFVLTVSAVVAATATFEGFLLVQPPRLFIIASLVPLTLWLFTVGDRLHFILAVMLSVFIPITLRQITEKHQAFIETLRLRIQNEFLAKELSLQYNLAEQASKSKSRFLAAASHDLRQPLAALMIFMELLGGERQLSPQGEDFLEKAEQATASLRSLLDALLDISKLDAQAIKPNLCSIAIQDLFNELEKEFLPLAEQKGIRLSFAACSSAVESDRTLLGQIMRNLISNALRYTPSGRVLVGCRRHQGMLTIEVHDTGIGIAEDQFANIFDEFYQIDNQERDRQQGLGLGLSIVNRAARLLGHAVTLRSRLGKGSSFAVSVPRALVTISEAKPVLDHSHEIHSLAGRLIAVIENEGAIRIGMQNLLQAWGCRVVSAESVAAMVKQLETHDGVVDMVISDFGLRGSQNGIDAIAALRQRCGIHLPALLFTGDISNETYSAAQNNGLPILYKPAKPEALHAAIAAALGIRKIGNN